MPLYLNGRPATAEEVVAAMPEEVLDRVVAPMAERIRARRETEQRDRESQAS